MLISHKKLIPLSIAVILGLQAHSAMSLPYQLSLNAEASARTLDNSISDLDSATNSSVYSYSHIGNTGYANTIAGGDSRGRFSTSAFGDGVDFSGIATLTQSYYITNDTDFDQLVDFNFKVNGGSLYTILTYDIPTNSADEYAVSGYSAEIFLNGNSVWNSSAILTEDRTGISLVKSGTELSTYNENSTDYTWNKQSFDLALGRFNAGESLNLEYIISTYVKGNFVNSYCFSKNEEDYVDGPCFLNDVSARFGNPYNINNNPSNFNPFTTRIAPNLVSEPESIVLLSLGLAFIRRRKQA